MRKVIIYLILIIGTLNGKVTSQPKVINDEEPIVGQLCPNFSFEKIDFYNKKKVTLADFRGKWLILDFWSKDCSGCIASFPTISNEQKDMKDSVQFLMIAYDDLQNIHRPMYKAYHNRLNLAMPCAFDKDSALFNQFNVGLLPHIVVVDSRGIVRAITAKLKGEKLKDLMNGKDVSFVSASYNNGKEKIGLIKYEDSIPFLVNGNGGEDSNFIYRSLLSKWSNGTAKFAMSSGLIHSERENHKLKNKGRFDAVGVGLSFLYRAAYFGKTFDDAIERDTSLYGKIWPNPILELKDTSLFKADYAAGKNIYCYSLVVPPNEASEIFMMDIMRSDLQHYFKYEAFFENRLMPYWRLIKLRPQTDKVEKKGNGPKVVENDDISWGKTVLRNEPMKDFLSLIEYYSSVTDDGTPLVNETGIDGNVDADVDFFKNDLPGLKASLNKNGFDLVKGNKVMKVLIIRDCKDKE